MPKPIRIGFLVPPGNPTVEPEMCGLAPAGVTVHFSRLVARGPTGTHGGQEERNRSHIAHIDECASLLAMVKPDVIVLAHTATSYTLGREHEATLLRRLQGHYGMPFVSAFGAVVAALRHLGATRVALGAPYDEEMTRRGKAHLERHGIEVCHAERLHGVENIYDEPPERAAELARRANRTDAQAVVLSGVGLPTLPVIEPLERELRKPVVSSATAMMWHALRTAGAAPAIRNHGRLLAGTVPGVTA